MAKSIPLEFTMRDIENSSFVEDKVRARVDKLGQYFHKVEYCKVVIEVPKKHPHQGKLYNVRIELGVPGKRLVSNHHVGENLYVEIRDAFNAMERQLESFARVIRGDVKAHEVPLTGEVVRIFKDEGYGFIEDAMGTEYYFQLSNLANGTREQIATGSKVQFQPVYGGDTLQAGHILLS